MKINSRINQLELPFSDIVLTQPNQAFTPRQILEQFARNEVVPSFNSSSDSLNEENFSEDELLDGDVVEFDDPMEAESHLIENQYELFKEDQSQREVHQSTEGASGETSSGVREQAQE